MRRLWRWLARSWRREAHARAVIDACGRELGVPPDSDGRVRPPNDLPLELYVVEGERSRLEIVLGVTMSGPLTLRIGSPSPILRTHPLIRPAHIRTLVEDVRLMGFELWLGDRVLELRGPVNLIDESRLTAAMRLATKLANRLPVVRTRLEEPFVPTELRCWRELADAWALDASDGCRELRGTRGGLAIRFRTFPKGKGAISVLEVEMPAGGLELEFCHPEESTNAYSDAFALREGFGSLHVRTLEEETAQRLRDADVLRPLPTLIDSPFRLTWSASGLKLRAQDGLTRALLPVATQLLAIANALGGGAPGSAYR